MSRSQIRISTNHGDIDFLLKPDLAPITVANILQYVDDKFYDGSVFHRVIDGFMIQGEYLPSLSFPH
jgi:cyclophilin family peptidyl-prolyl cis-trans isomerase